MEEYVNIYGCDYCTDECEYCEDYHDMGTAFYCACVDDPIYVQENEHGGLTVVDPRMN